MAWWLATASARSGVALFLTQNLGSTAQLCNKLTDSGYRNYELYNNYSTHAHSVHEATLHKSTASLRSHLALVQFLARPHAGLWQLLQYAHA